MINATPHSPNPSTYDINQEKSLPSNVADVPTEYLAWINKFLSKLKLRSLVLDLGCGCGMPVALKLVTCGHNVVGVDEDARQIARARRLVPDAKFLVSAIDSIEFEYGQFDAVLCLYSFSQLLAKQQQELIGKVAFWLKPQGLFLFTAGTNYMAGSATSREESSRRGEYQTYINKGRYKTWLKDAGFQIGAEDSLRMGDEFHNFFWTSRK